MDCIVKVIKGPDTGLSCRLQAGPNLIGRSSRAVLQLTAPDISWEHVLVIRNGEDYAVENLSSMGTYIDDAKITGRIKLRTRDQLRLSRDTVLRFESESGDGGLLGNRKLLLGLAGLALVLLGWLVLANPFARSEVGDSDWERVFNQTVSWTDRQAACRQLPRQVSQLFREGWRLEQAKDYQGSYATWLRLQLLLDGLEDRRHFSRLSVENPNALQMMLSPAPSQLAEPGDAELAGALVQFVKRRLLWSSRFLKTSGLAP